MKIILLSDVPKIGKKFEIKEVSSGHATNFLIPNKLAVSATPDAIKRIELMKKGHDAKMAIEHELIVKSFAELDGKAITIKAKSNEKGHLFAGLHQAEIAKEIEKATRISLKAENIVLEEPVKQVGEHKITLVNGEVKATIKLIVA